MYVPVGIVLGMNSQANSAERILDAALKLFSEKGYEASSIREICARARITRPTLYYFFQSKEGVHRALVEQVTRNVDAIVEQGLAAPGDFRAKCKGIARVFFSDAMRHPKLWRFFYNLVWATHSPLAAELHEWYQVVAQRMAEAARAAIAAGEISPSRPQIHLLVMMGATGEALSNYLVWGRPRLTPQLADELVDAVFDGWTKGPKS